MQKNSIGYSRARSFCNENAVNTQCRKERNELPSLDFSFNDSQKIDQDFDSLPANSAHISAAQQTS
jgi:hypothetical protein